MSGQEYPFDCSLMFWNYEGDFLNVIVKILPPGSNTVELGHVKAVMEI